MFNELYEVLGVSGSASVDEIHAAFRKKAREHHPDLGGDRKKFQQLNDAYEEILKIKKAERAAASLKMTAQPESSAEVAEPTHNPFQSPSSQSQPKRRQKQKVDRPAAETKASLKHLLTGKLPLQDQTTYFILVNALDIFITYLHLRSGNVEANPIANFFFKNWNIVGMIAFKLSIVATVCVIAQIVAMSSIKKASRLLNFGTFVFVCIVVYSIWLLASR
jgi:hypothetical protein